MRNLDIEFEQNKLMTEDQSKKWLKKQLKILDKFEKQSKKSNRKVG